MKGKDESHFYDCLASTGLGRVMPGKEGIADTKSESNRLGCSPPVSIRRNDVTY